MGKWYDCYKRCTLSDGKRNNNNNNNTTTIIFCETQPTAIIIVLAQLIYFATLLAPGIFATKTFCLFGDTWIDENAWKITIFETPSPTPLPRRCNGAPPMQWHAQVCASDCVPSVSLLLKKCLDSSLKVIPSLTFAYHAYGWFGRVGVVWIFFFFDILIPVLSYE